MKNLKKSQLFLIALLAIVVVAFVVYRVTVRPPAEELAPEARVAEILDKGGCIDCHSANAELPFYADMPKTLDEIQESEIRYLTMCEQKGTLATDFIYFWEIVYPILVKRARSN